jgi:hypothetical protein
MISRNLRGGALAVAVGTAIAFSLLGPRISNHTEAEDAYCYALDVVESRRHNPQEAFHILYTPFLRLIYGLGWFQDAFGLIVVASQALALSSLGLFLCLMGRIGVPRHESLLGSAGLAFSYGFWRYSQEAEVYVLAVALCLLLLWAVAAGGLARPSRSPLMGFLGGLAILGHILGAALAAVAVPLELGLKRRWRPLVSYLAALVVTVLAGYSPLSHGYQPARLVSRLQGAAAAAPSSGAGFGPSSLPKACVGFGQTVLSGSFVFLYPQARAALRRAFPNRVLDEEEFLARHTDRWVAAAAPLLIVAMGALAAAIVHDRARASGGGRSRNLRRLCVVWLVSTAGFITWYEPPNPKCGS